MYICTTWHSFKAAPVAVQMHHCAFIQNYSSGSAWWYDGLPNPFRVYDGGGGVGGSLQNIWERIPIETAQCGAHLDAIIYYWVESHPILDRTMDIHV